MSDERAGQPPLIPELGGPPDATFEAPPRPQLASEPLWLAILRNRLLISAASAVAVLVLIALVLVAIGREEGPVGSQTFAGATTPDPRSLDERDGAIVGTVRTTVSLRNGPGFEFPILGTIPRNAAVNIVGRDEEQTWIQVVWPPGSSLRGWLSLAFVEIDGDEDLAALPIEDAGAGPSVDVPTVVVPTFVLPPDIIIVEPTIVIEPEPTTEPTPAGTQAPTVTPWPTFALPTPTPPDGIGEDGDPE